MRLSTRHRMRRRGHALLAVLAASAAALTLAGCASPGPAPTRSSTAARTPTETPRPTPTSTPDPLANLTLQQRVGQLFMVGTPATAASQTTLDAVANLHVGNIFLSGRSHQSVAATKAVVDQFTALVNQGATGGVRLFVATDQEGGEVQVLQGPGFDTMPSGLDQGSIAPGQLQADAATWGAQLASAGLNMNLAPVADLVASPQAAEDNPPIGGFDREYGYDPTTIVQHAGAFWAGMRQAGVVGVVKHFPGLGAVDENTDTDAGVTDTTTGAASPSVGVFHDLITAGVRCVMVSSAVYTQLDPANPAVFSSAVLQSLLRDQLGFTGVIMTDDLSAAKQVAAWSPADRALDAIAAGADIVLVSASPELAAPMVQAVVAKAQADPAFDALVNAAARRVLALKDAV